MGGGFGQTPFMGITLEIYALSKDHKPDGSIFRFSAKRLAK